MKTIISIFAVLTLSIGPLVLAETSVRDLNPPARVSGVLRKPLGTRMIITGILAERVMLVYPLAVSQIDGQVIKDKVSIEIRGKPQIKQGVNYRLEGYESGGFSGPPSWLSPEAQQPFQYHSFFIVTKVIEPGRESNAQSGPRE